MTQLGLMDKTYTPHREVYQASELGHLDRMVVDLSPAYQLSTHRCFDTDGNCFQLSYLACNGLLGHYLADFYSQTSPKKVRFETGFDLYL